MFRFGSALSTEPDLRTAVAEATERTLAPLRGAPPDLALLFVSGRDSDELAEIASHADRELRAGVLLGCIGAGTIGESKEVEAEPGLALWAASLPGAQVEGFHLRFEEEKSSVDILPGSARDGTRGFLLLVDPTSYPADAVLRAMNDRMPGVPILGGVAGGEPGGGRLVLDGNVVSEGAVGVRLSGSIAIRPVVSQGCRPIGQAFVATKVDRNVILELGGRPALLRLQEMLKSASPEERVLASRALHVGLVVDEYRREHRRGDFLVRNLLGIDPKSGAIAINDLVRLGQTVQFQVRDAETADEDLRTLLAQEKQARGGQGPPGALLFSCNGRGTHLFGIADHDARVIQEVAGPAPLAGFFAAGEIGPIGPHNFLHGYTASLALFYEEEEEPERPPPSDESVRPG
jgi:small ligand-binding sensory domain FIST